MAAGGAVGARFGVPGAALGVAGGAATGGYIGTNAAVAAGNRIYDSMGRTYQYNTGYYYPQAYGIQTTTPYYVGPNPYYMGR
jgi:hypothetical protein